MKLVKEVLFVKDATYCDGHYRSFYYMIPTNVDKITYDGVVFFFHGHGSNGLTIRRNMDEDGSRSWKYKLLFVFPNGLGASWNSGHGFGYSDWNSDGWYGFSYEHNIDDVYAVHMILTHLKSKYAIGEKLCFVGCSNGACFSYRLAAEIEKRFGDIVTAFAPFAGTIGGYAKDGVDLVLNIPAGVHHASVFAVHGLLDGTIKYNDFNRIDRLRADYPFPESTGIWIDYIGNSGRSPYALVENDEYIENRYQGITHIGEAGIPEVVARVYKNEGHVLPYRKFIDDVLGFFASR